VIQPQRRRLQSRRRRRLIAAVIIIDLVGIGALVWALSRSSHHQTATVASTPTFPQPTAATATAPTTLTVAAATPNPHKHLAKKHRHVATGTIAGSDPQATFDRLAATNSGHIGVAIAPLGSGPVRTFGTLQIGHAWSTMKVPVLATVLSELEHNNEILGPEARADATRALDASDNAAAEALFAHLEQTDGGLVGASQAVQSTLQAAGDETTQVNTAPNSGGFTTWGQSEWTASGEVAFYRSLARGCLLDSNDTSYVLGLMRNVESDQRWGAGSAGFPSGVPLGLKGGWGPEGGGGYLVRQTAIVGSGTQGYVFSMLTRPSNGSFSTGAQQLTQIAGWIARTFSVTQRHPGASCG
jgi:hypothetical protein